MSRTRMPTSEKVLCLIGLILIAISFWLGIEELERDSYPAPYTQEVRP